MSKFIYGYEVIKELDIEPFELVEYAKQGWLHPYTEYGKRICDVGVKMEYKKREESRLYELKQKLKTLTPRQGKFEEDRTIDDANITQVSNSQSSLVVPFRVPSGEIKFDREEVFEEIKKKIAELENNGVTPRPVEEILPKKYQDCCFWKDFEVSTVEELAEETIDDFLRFKYPLSGVEELKAKRLEVAPNTTKEANPYLPVTSDQNLTWSDITINFLSDTEIHIQFQEGGKPESVTRRFNQVGFGDGRKEYAVPVTSWNLLFEAASRGTIPHTYENRSIVESTVKDLRKRLRGMFPAIKGDPVPHVKSDGRYSLHSALSIVRFWNYDECSITY